MKIVIDYRGEIPTEDEILKMEQNKLWVIEKLQPIWAEFEHSEGILILYTDTTFEFVDTPYKIGMEIKKLIGPKYF